MTVKIVKCSNPNWWYNRLIGDIFQVSYENHPNKDGRKVYTI